MRTAPIPPDAAAIAAAHADWRERGYAVIRGVFTPAEAAAMRDAADRLRREIQAEGTSYRRGNLVAWVVAHPTLGPLARGMQWPAHRSPELAAARTDPRMLAIVRPLLGDDVRQIINQLHWKPPGSAMAVDFHTDRENRTPAEAFREVERSYLQTGIALDPMRAGNGPLLVVPGSHRRRHRLRAAEGNFRAGDPDRGRLAEAGYGPADVVPVLMEPGDVALWHVDTIHGSDANRSPDLDRCLYINGYVDARRCMRGHWAFIGGRPIPLPAIDVPVLIQHDGIWEDLAKASSERPLAFRD